MLLVQLECEYFPHASLSVLDPYCTDVDALWYEVTILCMNTCPSLCTLTVRAGDAYTRSALASIRYLQHGLSLSLACNVIISQLNGCGKRGGV